MFLKYLFLLPLICHVIRGDNVADDEEPNKIVCYHGSWSAKRTNLGNFRLETDMDPFLCTHLIYAFCGLQQTGELKINDRYLDLDDDIKGRGNFQIFNNLKLKNPSLKTLISVGGWTEGSLNFSIVAADPTKRATFFQSSIELLHKYNFNGLDINWEYPNERHGLKNNDRENFIIWLKELKEGFKPYDLLLTAAVKAVSYGALNIYNISELVKQVDFLNIMSYSLIGAWSKGVGIHSPLYAGPSDEDGRAKQRNVDAIAQFWIRQGTPRHKIVMGVPFFGVSFTLLNSKNHRVGDAHNGTGIGGPYTNETGVLAYYELCEMFKMKSTHWRLKWEPEEMVPYAYRGNQWIGYDNERSVALKADYVKKHNLGGLMIWTVEMDDFRGICGGKRYPLLRAINKVLRGITTSDDEKKTPRSFRIFPIHGLMSPLLYLSLH